MFVFTDFWRPMHGGTDRQTNTQRDGGLVLQWSDLFWTSQFEILASDSIALCLVRYMLSPVRPSVRLLVTQVDQ